MRILYEWEIENIPKYWQFWPGAYKEEIDGCIHAMVTDPDLSGPDTFEVVIIPNNEVRCFYE